MFEAAGYAGGHTHAIRVDTPNETRWVDTRFIAFNDRDFPSFERQLGVCWQLSEMGLARVSSVT